MISVRRFLRITGRTLPKIDYRKCEKRGKRDRERERIKAAAGQT